MPVAVRDHPAVSGGVDGTKAEHHRGRGIRRVEPLQHPPHRLGGDERHVAVEDKHVARESGERAFRLMHGMAGAELFRLMHHLRADRRDGRLHLLAPRADHHHGARRLQRGDARQQVQQHRPPRERVKHLVQVGFHPRAIAGGEDDGGNRSVVHAERFRIGSLPFP